MNNANPDPFQQQQQQQLHQQHPPAQPQLTVEEQRVLKRCQDEAFYQRCMPLSILSTVGVVAGANRGLIAPSPRFGLAPKILLAGATAYFMGKFSYAQKCADKFLIEAPDSNIAEAIRKRRGMAPREEFSLNSSSSNNNNNSDHEAVGEAFNKSAEDETTSTSPTYDDLRRKHRQQYTTGSLTRPTVQDAASAVVPRAAPQEHPSSSTTYDDPSYAPPSKLKQRKNKYGDEGFEWKRNKTHSLLTSRFWLLLVANIFIHSGQI